MISYSNATLEWNILMTMAFNHLPSSDSQELFGNCALVQSRILHKWLDGIYIHLVCGRSNSYMVDSLRMTSCAMKGVGAAN